MGPSCFAKFQEWGHLNPYYEHKVLHLNISSSQQEQLKKLECLRWGRGKGGMWKF